MPVTSELQALIITNALMELRPAWNRTKILELLQENRNNPTPYGLILQACITYANDPAKQTPQFLFQSGRHWDSVSTPGTAISRPPADPCEDHDGEPKHSCKCCRADVLAGIRPKTHIGIHWDIPTT